MSLKNALDSFAFDVVEGAKKNLRAKNKNTSGKLSKSLDYTLNVSNKKDKYTLTFLMEDYAEFIDRGVKGAGGTKADGSKWKTKRISNVSIWKQRGGYKSKRPPAKVFSNWIVKKGIAPRNNKGQFISRKSLQFAIANSVFHQGIKATNFFSTPFKKESKKLAELSAKAVSDEIDFKLKFILQ